MTDVHTPEQRARNMRAIGRSNTQPELIVRKVLHAAGFRFRLHIRELPGTPDIVLPKYHGVIFIHGCFWHGHDCHMFKVPRTRTDFWLSKIDSNRRRDAEAAAYLLKQGWRVLTIWECAIKGRARLSHLTLLDQTVIWLNSEDLCASIEGHNDKAQSKDL